MSSDASAILSLPLIQASQAQKHVTHNEALRLLDVLVQAVVLSRNAAEPSPGAAIGARHLVPNGATGAFAGHDGKLAFLEATGWAFLTVLAGWQCHVLDEGITLVFDGSTWRDPGDRPRRFPMLGVASDADATNRLTVASSATLLTHVGAGHQLKVNKSSVADTASLLFQTGWSGRAEMGTAGSDSFSLKLSADGATWRTGLSFEPTTGKASFPAGAEVSGELTGTAVTQTSTDTTAGRLLKVGDLGLGGSGLAIPDNNADTIIVTGFYGVGSATTGVPVVGYNQSRLLHLQGAPGYAAQMLLVAGAGSDLWHRRNVAGTWEPWRRVYNNRSILGTVSQSAGIPTGAIIERGSNANGEYVKWADGTMKCTHQVSGDLPIANLLAGGYRSSGLTWTFPAAFTSAPRFNCNPVGLSAFGAVGASMLATSAAVVLTAPVSQATAVRTIDLTADGRWF